MQPYLQTLGTLAIHSTHGIASPTVREAAFLAYLAIQPTRRANRQDLMDLLWSHLARNNAKHSLSQLLYAIKVKFPQIAVAADPGHVSLGGLDIDVVAIRRDVASNNRLRALDRYAGRFLSAEDVTPDSLSDWRDAIEDDVASTISEVLQEQSHACATADLPKIIRLCELVLATHPHNAHAQIALVEATFRTDPSKAERIHGMLTRSQDDSLIALPPMDAFRKRITSSPAAQAVPFTGRESELASLLECWEKARTGDGQVVVLLGEPGIGKTRLADQFLRRVAIRGGAVWVATCCAATQRLTYSVAGDLIREHVGSAAADLQELLPHSLASDSKGMPSSDEFRQALTDTLTTHLINRTRTQPVAVLLDDAQWADEYSALLFAYWAYRLRSERVMIVLTVRTHEAEEPPDWILSDLGRPSRMTVGSLSVAAAEAIVNAYEKHANLAMSRSQKDAILWQSAGRPFLLLEALASLANGDAALPSSAPVLSESAESLLLRRFRSLHRDAMDVAGILAVFGRPVPEKELRSVSGFDDTSFAAALDKLHTRGIAHLDGGVVAFPHDLMRETVYRSLLPATRTNYHRRLAAYLSANAGPDGLVAQHYAKAGDREGAGGSAIRAAELAWSAHSYSDYEFYCRLCIDSGDVAEKRQAAMGLARYLVQVGRSSELDAILPLLAGEGDDYRVLLSISVLERELASGTKSVTDILTHIKGMAAAIDAGELEVHAALAATLFCVAFDACTSEVDYVEISGLPSDAHAKSDSQLQLESVASVWYGATRDVHSALTTARSMLDNIPTSASPTTQAACLYSYATVLLLAGHINEARAYFEDALRLAQECGDVRRQLAVHVNNGVALMESDEMERARQSFERAATTPHVHFRIRCFTNLSIMHYEDGDMTLAAQAAESVLSMNVSYQSPGLGSTSSAILGLIALRQNDFSTAKRHASAIGQHSWASFDDVSYTATFLSQMLAIAGQDTEALLLLSDTISHTRSRDALCAMRLECAKASLLMRSQPDSAYRLARNVEIRADSLGANRIRNRAREILLDLKAS